MKIKTLTIEGFRSFKKTIWSPGALNLIIGPNGSGKSNLLSFLEFISISAKGKLGKHIQSQGGMESLVWDGTTLSIGFVLETEAENTLAPESYSLELSRLGFGNTYKIVKESLINSYKLRLKTEKNPFKFLERASQQAVIFDESENTFTTPEEFVSEEESLLSIASGPFFTLNHYIPPFQKALASIIVYQNLYTGKDAPIRHPVVSRVEKTVDPDGQNLVSVLHTLYTGNRDFKNDINAAMQTAFGDDFEELVFAPASDQKIQMRIRWKSLKREQSAAELSDGTLRFLFLLTVFASPSLPSLIAIDEPETGLHPSMLPIVAEYATEAATRSQIVLTTHSPQFLEAFSDNPPVTTVTQWENGETTLHTLKGDDLSYWLQEYSLGSLFQSGELEQMR